MERRSAELLQKGVGSAPGLEKSRAPGKTRPDAKAGKSALTERSEGGRAEMTLWVDGFSSRFPAQLS